VSRLIVNLALLENEVAKLPDIEQHSELFKIHDEIQNEMVFLFGDFINFLKIEIESMKKHLEEEYI